MEFIERGVNNIQDHTRKLYEFIEKTCLDIGDKCDRYMDGTSGRTKYWCEVLLRVPLMFIIHQWLLLSPYSNYWMIDLVLFVVRYGGLYFTLLYFLFIKSEFLKWNNPFSIFGTVHYHFSDYLSR